MNAKSPTVFSEDFVVEEGTMQALVASLQVDSSLLSSSFLRVVVVEMCLHLLSAEVDEAPTLGSSRSELGRST